MFDASPQIDADRERGARLMAHLRDETRARHDAVEALPIFKAPFEPGFDADKYRALLTVQERAYRDVETALEDWAHRGLFDILGGGSTYAALIGEDLDRLGRPSDLPEPRPVPHPIPAGAAAALGARYVLDGSMMGGRHLRKTLTRSFSAEFVDDLAFHGRLIARTDLKALRGRLAESLGQVDDGHAEEALAGAHWAFECFGAAHGA